MIKAILLNSILNRLYFWRMLMCKNVDWNKDQKRLDDMVDKLVEDIHKDAKEARKLFEEENNNKS